MPQIWRLQDAKNKFGKLLENAVDEGPQIVTKHGKILVVVLSIEEYRNLKMQKGKISPIYSESSTVGGKKDLKQNELIYE